MALLAYTSTKITSRHASGVPYLSETMLNHPPVLLDKDGTDNPDDPI
jgi:hypothetical protein